jgi:hypothetical protein
MYSLVGVNWRRYKVQHSGITRTLQRYLPSRDIVRCRDQGTLLPVLRKIMGVWVSVQTERVLRKRSSRDVAARLLDFAVIQTSQTVFMYVDLAASLGPMYLLLTIAECYKK